MRGMGSHGRLWEPEREQLTQAVVCRYTQGIRALDTPRAKLEPDIVATGDSF